MDTCPLAPSVNRRTFLQHAGAFATAAAVANWSSAYADEVRPKVRLGVVGGRFGCTFQFHEHPGCTVAAVSDLRPERRSALMTAYGCDKSYESLEKLLTDPTIDAVFIATEAPNHVPHCLAALSAGKHVLCAVPAAMTLEECQQLVDAVERSGLTYMMAETSFWQQPTISARKFFEAGEFGKLYQVASAYRHAGLEELWVEDGKPTWRHGFPPMLYPTHCTAHLVGVTGDRLTHVSCQGWGDGSDAIAGNPYDNPFWNETAQFRTRDGCIFDVEIWWAGAHVGGERAEWFGDKMSFLSANGYGTGPLLVRSGAQTELDGGGFVRAAPQVEPYAQPHWWDSDLLPPPLRHDSGHEGSHCFITHEFIDSIQRQRRPAVDVYEAVAYTAPGIVAHQSALKGGEQLAIPSFDKA
jgi:predicted dehydrogenase